MAVLMEMENVYLGELEDDHHNFCGKSDKEGANPVVDNRKGVCWYLTEGPAIYPDGSICYCPTDIFQETKFGNIFIAPWDKLMGEGGPYLKIKENHNKAKYTGMCENCSTWKHPDYRPRPYQGRF